MEQGYTKRYDHALQVMKAIPYGWREYSAEDTLRFYALRLHEVGMLKSTPQKLLAEGTDWRFLNELKQRVEDLGERSTSVRISTGKERPMQIIQNRRRFLAGAASAGAAGLFGTRHERRPRRRRRRPAYAFRHSPKSRTA